MLHPMSVGRRSVLHYQSLVDRELIAELREIAADIRGMRICHVSGHGDGGGVSELLASTVPLFTDLGLHATWRVLGGRPSFFRAAAALHDGLQGAEVSFDGDLRRTFERYSLLNAGGMDGPYDVVVVHDAHPLGLRGSVEELDDATWIWRCHLDMSTPAPWVFDVVRPLLDGYDLSVFHMPQYAPAEIVPEPVVIPPAIDPLAPKNMGLPRPDAADVVARFGVDPGRPLMVQVSRFDPWKDPLGVIDAFRAARTEVPGLQLALVGPRSLDDGAAEFFGRVVDHAAGDPDIHLLADPQRVGPIEVNALQTHADVVVQKSLREGFGLTVTEALWKARPTVASNIGGIPSQIADGSTGFLVDGPAECARRVVDVIRDPAGAAEMAERGKQHVRHGFLTPRMMRDWLSLLRRVANR